MARVTASQFQEKHARNLKNSVSDIKRGVENMTVSPTALAAAKEDKMLANLTEAVQSGKWKKGLLKVTKEEWQGKMINIGIPRISAGIDAAKDKVVAFAEKLLPHVDSGVAKVKSMPDLTLEDSIQRMITMTRHMSEFKK